MLDSTLMGKAAGGVSWGRWAMRVLFWMCQVCAGEERLFRWKGLV